MNDGWLEPFIGDLRASGQRILDIGCGTGLDSETLVGAGFGVVAFDRSPAALASARARATGALLLLADVRSLPFRDGSFDCAVASLSLHYLPWAETIQAFSEVRRVLPTGATFLFRVNAMDDVHYGAGQGREIELGYFHMERPGEAPFKRFFDAAAVKSVVGRGFAIRRLSHQTTERFGLPKQVWECLASTV